MLVSSIKKKQIIEEVSFQKASKQSTSFHETQNLTEMRVTCKTAGEWGTLIC